MASVSRSPARCEYCGKMLLPLPNGIKVCVRCDSFEPTPWCVGCGAPLAVEPDGTVHCPECVTYDVPDS